MIFPTLASLVKKTGSNYSLVIAVTKRAREITDGSEPLVRSRSDKSVSIATLELSEDKIKVI